MDRDQSTALRTCKTQDPCGIDGKVRRCSLCSNASGYGWSHDPQKGELPFFEPPTLPFGLTDDATPFEKKLGFARENVLEGEAWPKALANDAPIGPTPSLLRKFDAKRENLRTLCGSSRVTPP